MGLAERVVELEAALAVRDEQIAALNAVVQTLEAELARLRREKDQHSGTSGKPPSSDSLADRKKQQEQRVSRAERRRQARAKAKKLMADKPKRNPGKQPGEPGASLRQVEDPDRVEVHTPKVCWGCGGGLADAEIVGCERRQVFDLPTRRLEVTEHQAQTRRCGCGTATKAEFPAPAKATACYGPLVRSVAVYLMAFQHVPVSRAAALLAEVCGAPVSTGWLAGLHAEAAAGLSGFLDVLRRQLAEEAVLHADETGARINGARYWFHVACTDLLTLLDCHERRGSEAFDAMGVLPFFTGVLVTDGWKPYWSYTACEHALCCAHLCRDLAAVAVVDRYRPWADDMADLLVEVKDAVEAVLADDNQTALTPKQLQRFRSRYTQIINRGYKSVPATHRAGTYDRDAYNLLRRLDTQRADVQRHWTNLTLSFDNNAAERDVRMVKLQQKISGGWRTLNGARAFCAVRSYLHTARKHGHRMLDVLTQLFQGNPWLPPTTGPAP